MQSTSSLLAAGELEPTGQFKHAFTVIAATVVEYLPTAQLSHNTSDATVVLRTLNVPATHCVQGPPLAPDDPALHLQSVSITLAAGEYEWIVHAWHTLNVPFEKVSAGQSVHGAEPVAVLNFPAAHTKHVAPSAPVYPALQTHLFNSPLPAGA